MGTTERRISTQPRIVVTGGGLAGLTAASFAARAGAAVTLIEARDSIGGRARTSRMDRGYLFNQGPHALYSGMAGSRILAELGITPRGSAPNLRAYGRLRGEIGVLPGTPRDAMRTKIVGMRTKVDLARMMGRPSRALHTEMTERSFAQWVDEQLHDDDARLLARMLGRVATYCADATGISADAAVPQMVGAMLEGVRYLDGGWQQLVDALTTAARAAGVTIESGARVDAVQRDDARGTVTVVVNDEERTADAVILAAGGPVHADHVLHGASAVVAGWAATQQPVHAASLDLALRRLPVPERAVAFGVDEPLYLSTHSLAADLGGDGGVVLHAALYADERHDGDDSGRRIEAFLDTMQPGWRDEVIVEQFGRRLVVAHGRPTPETGLAGRPGPAVADLEGVFVAGDWVGSEGLLADAAIASAREAARLAVRAVATPRSGSDHRAGAPA